VSGSRIRRVLGVVALVTSVSAIGVARLPIASAAPASVIVDTTEDSYDGSCGDGDCSLRDAVKSAPAGATVLVPPGFYALSIAGGGGIGVGSIELRRRITLAGDGETGAFIDAGALGEAAFTAAPSAGADPRFTMENLTIFGAQDPALTGGGIRVDGGTLHVAGVTVTGGLADRGAGIAVEAAGSLELVDSLVIGNEAISAGGGIWSEGVLSVASSAVADNRAGDGGGIWSTQDAAMSLENVTVAENTATGEGGGLWIAGPAEIGSTTIGDNDASRGGGIVVATGAVGIAGSIVAGNRAERAPQCAASLHSLGDNVDQGHRCGFDAASDLRDTDPLLRRLGTNGGPTPTMALSTRSPAVGLADDCGGRDQRGAPRDRRCDAGAYEVVRCLGKRVNIVGTPHADEFSGGRGRDVFLGMGGDDEFQGSIGKDRACGGAGNDLLIAGPGDDRFDGDAGNDRVRGESGGDVIWGGEGRDRLVGGPGDDTCEADVLDRRARGCEVLFAGAASAPT
jgi:CSLREA domain-containing protein